jgi:hypothetical protein
VFFDRNDELAAGPMSETEASAYVAGFDDVYAAKFIPELAPDDLLQRLLKSVTRCSK